MMHETGLITTIVAGLVLAFIFGALANRLRLPPLVGYLVAGVVVGPYSPGFVADAALASQLAEIGVILLMFGVGLHFSLKDLMSVQAVAIPGALGRIIGGTVLGMGLGVLLGWSIWAGMLFGLALSVASTVVLLKALQDRHMVDSDRGRIAIGWVIVEDIAMILALVLIPAFSGLMGGTVAAPNDPFVSLVERLLKVDIGIWGVIGITVVKLAAFVGVMLVVGRRLIPLILHYTAHTGSRELFRLAVLAVALGVAAGASYLFGVSLALGAFFAGMILSESELSHRAAQESLPLRDAFAVLFFVSVGMLFDPSILVRNPLPVLATLFIIVIGKTIIAYLLIVLFRRPASSALVIAVSLAQIGEFSFILAALGVGLGILPKEGQDLILAGAILSIVLNPILFWGATKLRPWLDANLPPRQPAGAAVVGGIEPALADSVAAAVNGAPVAEPAVAVSEDDTPHPTSLTGHTILVGYDRVGRVVAQGLKEAHAPFLVIEDADSRVAAAREAGIEVVISNAASHAALVLANVKSAQRLLVAIPNAFEAGNAIDEARKTNPGIRIVTRAHSDEEEAYLKHLGADIVIMGEREIGMGILAMLGDLEPEIPPAPPVEATPPVVPKLAPVDNILAGAIPVAAVAAEAAAAPAALPDHEVVAAEEPEDEFAGIGLEPSTNRNPDLPAVSPETAPAAAAEAQLLAASPEPANAPETSEPVAQPAEPEVVAEPSEPVAHPHVPEPMIVEPASLGLAAAESGLVSPAALFPLVEPTLDVSKTGAAEFSGETTPPAEAAPAAPAEPVVPELQPVLSDEAAAVAVEQPRDETAALDAVETPDAQDAWVHEPAIEQTAAVEHPTPETAPEAGASQEAPLNPVAVEPAGFVPAEPEPAAAAEPTAEPEPEPELPAGFAEARPLPSSPAFIPTVNPEPPLVEPVAPSAPANEPEAHPPAETPAQHPEPDRSTEEDDVDGPAVPSAPPVTPEPR